MAQSVGEAAARGLEAGFMLATNYQNRIRNQRRQEQQDAIAAEDRARTIQRQERADRSIALAMQEAELAREAQALANNPSATPEMKQDFTLRSDAFKSTKDRFLAEASGYDPQEVRKAAAADIEAIKTGDLSKVKPGQLTRAVAAATGRSANEYRRIDGKPSAIEQAAMDFAQGMEAGDEQRTLRGLNTIFAPQLRKGIGDKSRHGGTIVAKQIIDVVPDPNSTQDDPKVIPTLRVYVNDGKGFRGPVPEGVPEGATGYYDAPLTESRSIDDNDPVKSISLSKAMDYIGQHMSLVEALNTPEAEQLFQADAGSGWDEQKYLDALSSYGAKKAKPVVKETVIPAGATVRRTVTDPDTGEVIEESSMQGAPKAPGTGRAETMLEYAQRMAKENGTTVEAEYEKIRQAGMSPAQRNPARGGRGGGGGGGKGSTIQSTKVDSDGYVVGIFRDGTSRRLTNAEGKPWKAQDFEKRIDSLAKEIGKSIAGLGKSPDEVRAEATRVLTANEAAAAPAAAPTPAAGSKGRMTKEEAAKAFGF